MDWYEYDDRQSRFRDSREELRDFEDRYYSPDKVYDRQGKGFDGRLRQFGDYDDGEVHQWRGDGKKYKVERRDGGGDVRRVEIQQKQIADKHTTQPRAAVHPDLEQSEGLQLKRFVTFYFTNFPAQLSNFYLRKGFEVCGMLEEVVVPSKRNANGEVYGFVRFANVCNVSKLLKAVNDVSFGQFRIRAKVARFDRSVAKVSVRESEGEGVEVEGKGKKVVGEGGKKMSLVEGEKRVSGVVGKGKLEEVAVDVGRKNVEEVRVGEVRVRLDKGKLVNVRRIEAATKGGGIEVSEKSKKVTKGKAPIEQQPSIQKMLRKYTSHGDDVKWARGGFMASVIQGKAISIVQSWIEDAGFANLDVRSLGADRVFIRSSSDVEVSTVLEGASEFSNFVRWDKNIVPFQRVEFIS